MTACMIRGCGVLFSLEISEDVSEIGYINLAYCYSLRNVAISPNADCTMDDDFTGAEHQIFDSYSVAPRKEC